MKLVWEQNKKQLIDSRVNDAIFYGGEISVCYTTKKDDITKGKKPKSTPYMDRQDEFFVEGQFLITQNTQSILTVTEIENGGVEFCLNSNGDNLSEFGINLPFNFMGKLGGGDWDNQFLFNSPYFSEDKNILYLYLTKPNGANIVVAVKGGVSGWKMDYSPYLGGHYFINVKLLANFDRAYKANIRENKLKFAVFAVKDFDDCCNKLSLYYNLPFIDFDLSGGKIGDKIKLKLYGKIDSLKLEYNNYSKIVPYSSKFTIFNEGITKIIPVYDNKQGGEIFVYGYDNLQNLYKKSMDTVDLNIINNHTDGNLCEHQCWASAMLRFLIKYKHMLTLDEVKSYENKLITLLDIITQQDVTKAIDRRTIYFKEHNDNPKYNIFNSTRIQEQFFGITILLDAYKYFNDDLYLNYAINTMDSFLENYQKNDGRIERNNNGIKEDYSTVCCAMIPIVDMANYHINIDSNKANYYFNCAKKLAEYIYNRGLYFPTEGGIVNEAQPEMEEGSISCSILSLLYYCKNVKNNQSYICKAKKWLDIHDNWVINTPLCYMKNSTLRWWETQWEGDADGPAICAGHAWTIWRAEADWIYYAITGDVNYKNKALNGFMTNLSKITSNGNSYTIYNPDLINGGGFKENAKDVHFNIANNFASIVDCGISRYVWIRINDCLL